MAQNDMSDAAPASALGPFPVGDSGWMAGDFQNGAGLLGLVPPLPSLSVQSTFGAGSIPATNPGGGSTSGPFPLGNTGWSAGDLQNGQGLLGLTPPSGGVGPAGPNTWNAAFGAYAPAASPTDTPIQDSGNASSSDDGASGDDDDPSDSPDDADEPLSDGPAQSNPSDDDEPDASSAQDARLDYGLATPGDAQLVLTGANDTLKRQWERREGRSWPRTEDGRSFHAHHKIARADGGAHNLSNIEPMHPDEHIAHHMAQGDFSRWAKQAAAAKGQVLPMQVPRLVKPEPFDPYDPEGRPPTLLLPQPGGPRLIPEPEWDEEAYFGGPSIPSAPIGL